jgi:hypothetical protein
MAEIGIMRVDEWKFERKPERKRVICMHLDPLRIRTHQLKLMQE